MRAIAILVVVLFHAGVPGFEGGYVGVDVFFVISGFVITGLLLRERASSGRTSILAFYGRRCRRIIPAAALVIVVTVVLSYAFLGSVGGSRAATDGKWAAVFLANFHFTSIGTSYLGAQLPPSPLQNYWSLSVEEQFYIVYPTIFLVLAGVRSRLSLRARLAIGLALVFCGSLIFSIIDTSRDPVGAYFSPFTRAWELALGALIAVGTPWLLKVPAHIATVVTWLGLGSIFFAVFTFTSHTAYPGSLVTIPVVGAAMIIGGGASSPRFGVESLLRLAPFQRLGDLSYSLYLWHWPILIVASEHEGLVSPAFPGSLGWVFVALVASWATYLLLENPIRHARALLRVRWASVALGAALTIATLVAVTAIGSDVGAEGTSTTSSAVRSASLPTVLHLVKASEHIRTVPTNLIPPVSQAVLEPVTNIGGTPDPCFSALARLSLDGCTFGDRSGSFTMVLYGDSHAAMWFPDIEAIAKRAHWRLVVITGGNCELSWYPEPLPGPLYQGAHCNALHQFAIDAINRIDPNLLIVAQIVSQPAIDDGVTPGQWKLGLEQQLRRVTAPKTAKIVIGNEPTGGGPDCLATHLTDVQACSTPAISPLTPYFNAEQDAAVAEGARYIEVTPWICTRKCSPIIGNYDVYFNSGHLALGYVRFLEGVLAQAIDLPASTKSNPLH
jgi:peptidoglycan/LPS O-acetylase OafA/YrhL